jgi:hypothetical protein
MQHNIRSTNPLLLSRNTRRAVLLVDGFYEWHDASLGGSDPGPEAQGLNFRNFESEGRVAAAPLHEDAAVGLRGGPKRPYLLQAGWDAAAAQAYREAAARLSGAQEAESGSADEGGDAEAGSSVVDPASPVAQALSRPLLWVAAAVTSDGGAGTPAEPKAGDTGVAVVTSDANAQVRWLHHRMPRLLTPAEAALWLDPDADAQAVAALLQRGPDAGAVPLVWTHVGDAVNRARRGASGDGEGEPNDCEDADCLLGVEEWRRKRMQAGIGRWAAPAAAEDPVPGPAKRRRLESVLPPSPLRTRVRVPVPLVQVSQPHDGHEA